LRKDRKDEEEGNARSVGETVTEFVERSGVLGVEVAVVDEGTLSEVGGGEGSSGLVVVRGSVVVGDVLSDREGELAGRVDVAEKDGGERRSTLSGGEVGEKDRSDVGVADPLAHVDLARSSNDDDSVVVAGGGVGDELVAAVEEL
jgi:hypothetical protein